MNERKRHLVATFGVSDFERKILERIFRLSPARAQTYRLVDEGGNQSADVALFDPSTQKALARWQTALSEHPTMKTVKIVPDKQGNASPSLSRPFLAKRVLTVLDGMVTATAKKPPKNVNASAEPPADGGQQPDQITKNVSGFRYRALVVDDSPMVRMQVGHALQDADIEVGYAESGEEALEMVNGESFDIIFLDVLMTGMDGYAVCKAIKRDNASHHIPVIMLTSRSSPLDKIKSKFSGCDAFLTKPVARGQFQKTVDQFLVNALAND